MNKSSFYIPSLVVGLIILGNLIIVWNTESKIPLYADNPPFRLDDYTRSFRISSESKLLHLLDEDLSTQWKKLGEGTPSADFDVELSLTHLWDGNLYATKNWDSLDLEFCSEQKTRFEVILREAINVDKELRLPDDEIFYSEVIQAKTGDKVSIDLKKLKDLPNRTDYPEGIYIVVLRGKVLESKSVPACLQSIKVNL
ncbi:MAG: hypothetical protein JJT78_00645 [Leptospira sp.]|nr:hypothetical protein [Leptospira sp.]